MEDSWKGVGTCITISHCLLPIVLLKVVRVSLDMMCVYKSIRGKAFQIAGQSHAGVLMYYHVV